MSGEEKKRKLYIKVIQTTVEGKRSDENLFQISVKEKWWKRWMPLSHSLTKAGVEVFMRNLIRARLPKRKNKVCVVQNTTAMQKG